MNKLLLSAVIFLAVSGAEAAGNCFKNVPARTRVFTKWETKKYSFCVEKEIESLISESCAHGKNCEATKQRMFPSSLKVGLAGHGNPSFSTCEIVGASPRGIEIMSGKFKGQSLVICEFPDKSYIHLTKWIIQYVRYGLPATPTK